MKNNNNWHVAPELAEMQVNYKTKKKFDYRLTKSSETYKLLRKIWSEKIEFEPTKEHLTGTWIKNCGLAIELKIKPNKPTESQQVALNILLVKGWKTDVCYSFEETKKAIDEYLT